MLDNQWLELSITPVSISNIKQEHGCLCFVRCLFVFFEGMLTLSLGTIFAHMLPMCSFALSRAKGRANTKTKTVVPLSTVQLAIKDCTKNLKDILKNHNGRSSAYSKLQLLSGRVKQAIETKAL